MIIGYTLLFLFVAFVLWFLQGAGFWGLLRNGLCEMFRGPCIKVVLLGLLMLGALPCFAQTPPACVSTNSACPAKPHKTADKDWWLLNGASWVLTAADAGNTFYATRDHRVREANPVFAYALIPATIFNTWENYRWKQEDDADRDIGRPHANYRWYVLPIINMVPHGIGLGLTIHLTGR
jgi:hypothetical protein